MILIHVSNKLSAQVHALPLTGHLAFGSMGLLSSFQRPGLGLFRNVCATYTVAMATQDMVTKGLIAYLFVVGSAALKLIPCADYWEGSLCHYSLLRRCVGSPRHNRILSGQSSPSSLPKCRGSWLVEIWQKWEMGDVASQRDKLLPVSSILPRCKARNFSSC